MREERPWLSQLWRGSEGWMCPPAAGEPPAHSAPHASLPFRTRRDSPRERLGPFSLSSRGNGIQLLRDELGLTPRPGGAGCHKISWGHFWAAPPAPGSPCPIPSSRQVRLAQGLGPALQQEQEFREAAPRSACKAGKLSQARSQLQGFGIVPAPGSAGPPRP